jgi:hypothetical protein
MFTPECLTQRLTNLLGSVVIWHIACKHRVVFQQWLAIFSTNHRSEARITNDILMELK